MEETERIQPHHAKRGEKEGGGAGRNLLFPESLGATEQQNFNKAILNTMKSKPYSPSQVPLFLKVAADRKTQ